MSGGIYKITNRINGRFYIGRAINFESRWGDHRSKLKNGKHLNKLLQEDWNRFGSSCFAFEVFEIIGDLSLMAKREYELLKDFYDCGVNCYNLIVSSGAAHGEGLSPKERQKRRREEEREWLRARGFSSWEALHTAILKGEYLLEYPSKK